MKAELRGRNIKGYMISTLVFMYKKNELPAYVSAQANLIEEAIFRSFRQVKPEQREWVRERLKAIYDEMKGVRLADINWSSEDPPA